MADSGAGLLQCCDAVQPSTVVVAKTQTELMQKHGEFMTVRADQPE